MSRHVVTHPLDALEARLDPARFMRVHRSALVNLDHIREMVSWFSGRYKLLLSGGHEVLASRSRSRTLRDRLSL
ncbi:MAG: LytTR family DNA-binding domain-containing protein [Bacteroidota bacterium]